MTNNRFVSSINNEYVRHLLALQEKTRKRKQTQTFVIEGRKEIQHAVAAGYRVLQFWIREGEQRSPMNQESNTSVFEVENILFEKLCYRKNTSKMIAVVEMKSHSLSTLSIPQNDGIFLIVESPEKPGNIGALLRSCDALGIKGLIVVNPKTDMYNPNVIRSSVGCIFTVPWATATQKEAFTFFDQENIAVFSAALHPNAKKYTSIEFPRKVALAVGNEHSGLSTEWINHKKQQPIIIPMQGQNDSLNVSVAAGIILSEIVRQQIISN